MIQIKGAVHSGGKIHRFITVDGERIFSVGDSPAKNVKTIDLTGRHIYPGFIDSHTHLLWYGLNLARCDLFGVKSEEDVYERIGGYLRRNPNAEFIIAEGFDETTFDSKGYPSKKTLDSLFPSIPVIVRRICGHIAVLNSEAHGLLKGKLKGNYDSSSGIAREGIILSLNTVLRPGRKEKEKALKMAQERFFSLGITSVGDMATYDSLDVYRSKDLLLNVFFYYPAKESANLEEWKDSKKAKLKGLKLFTDGSIGGRTASLSRRYRKSGGSGEIVLSSRDFKSAVKDACKNDWQLAVHAIGDNAIEHAIKHLSGRSGDRIEHFELASKNQIERVKESGILLSMQPNFLGNWAMKNQMYEERLDKRYYSFNNVFGYIYKLGIPMALGSDCMPPSPIYGLESLSKAQFECQRLSASTGLNLYTEGSAAVMGEGKDFGALKEGFFADMAILDKPIEAVSSGRVGVVMTFKRGKQVFTKE